LIAETERERAVKGQRSAQGKTYNVVKDLRVENHPGKSNGLKLLLLMSLQNRLKKLLIITR